MKFYIVTPCYNALRWLPRAVRAVADQAGDGVEVHHHIQDGGSKDGTPAWLEEWQRTHADTPGYTFSYESGKDDGMYDAINRGWAKMPEDADVTAHLNSDEQYLPGALRGVAAAFAAHPEADIVETGFYVVDEHMRYICHRRPLHPKHHMSFLHVEMDTLATFHRAPSFRRHGVRFDATYKVLGDQALFRDIMALHPRVHSVPSLLTGLFTITGGNLMNDARGLEEYQRILAPAPWWVKRFARPLLILSSLRMRWEDAWAPKPQAYEVYESADGPRCLHRIRRATMKRTGRTVGEEG
ncbi:MAG: glycosyltransferase [Akkermansia sp.]|nr:glycosyltransferase [Akkermansia sp.]